MRPLRQYPNREPLAATAIICILWLYCGPARIFPRKTRSGSHNEPRMIRNTYYNLALSICLSIYVSSFLFDAAAANRSHDAAGSRARAAIARFPFPRIRRDTCFHANAKLRAGCTYVLPAASFDEVEGIVTTFQRVIGNPASLLQARDFSCNLRVAGRHFGSRFSLDGSRRPRFSSSLVLLCNSTTIIF